MRVLLFISALLLMGMSRPEVRESIEQVLSERHPTDNKETWTAMGVDTPLVIIEMLDSGVDAYKRVRLLEALGYFQSPEVSDRLRKEARESKNPQYRISSLKGLMRSEGEAAIEFAREFLDDSDLDVRKLVKQSLVKWGAMQAEPVRKIKPQGRLKPSGTNENKPELALLGQWEGYAITWNEKKKQIIPKKVSVQFDLGLGDRLILRTKLEDQKEYTEVKIGKEKWKWQNSFRSEILEIQSDHHRMFVKRI